MDRPPEPFHIQAIPAVASVLVAAWMAMSPFVALPPHLAKWVVEEGAALVKTTPGPGPPLRAGPELGPARASFAKTSSADTSPGRPRAIVASTTAMSRDALVDALLVETNRVRREWHLPRLALSEALGAPAQEHAEDMLARDYFAHESPDGETPPARVHRLSPRAIVLGVRENIAKSEGETGLNITGKARDVIDGWMRSKGHRENLLNADSTHVGFGAAEKGTQSRRVAYAVQVLGVVVGSWDRDPPRSVRTPARWTATLEVPVEFFLRDLSRPRKTYTVRGRPDVVWTGGVPLTVMKEGSRVHVELPRLAPGRYALMGRLPPQTGYQELRELEVMR